MMNMVFTVTSVQAAVAAEDHYHVQEASASHHDCMNHGDESPDGKAHADGCHSGACCHAMSTSVMLSSTIHQQQLIHSFFQPMLAGIVLPTDIRPPILAA
jgi:hypothetical protein